MCVNMFVVKLDDCFVFACCVVFDGDCRCSKEGEGARSKPKHTVTDNNA